MFDQIVGATLGIIQGVTFVGFYHFVLSKAAARFYPAYYSDEVEKTRTIQAATLPVVAGTVVGIVLIVAYLALLKLSHFPTVFRTAWVIAFIFGLLLRRIVIGGADIP